MSQKIDVCGVVISTRARTKKGGLIRDIKAITSKSGWRYFSYLTAETAFYDLLRLVSLKKTLAQLAKAHQIPVIKTTDINSNDTQARIAELNPDILFSGFFNLKLEASTWNIAKLGAVNIHPALLPSNRGVDPVFYGLLRNESSLGVTLHRIDADFDTGEILDQRKTAKRTERSLLWHNSQLFKVGAELFAEYLRRGCTKNTVEPIQDSGNYDSWPSSQQVSQLRGRLWHWRDIKSLFFQ